VLVEGVPGLGKTLLVRALATALDCSFARVQFTPDLMPATSAATPSTTRSRTSSASAAAGVHQPAARRRDQPRAGEDAGGACWRRCRKQQVTIEGRSYPLRRPSW
jgi:MoxR-like ATPase